MKNIEIDPIEMDWGALTERLEHLKTLDLSDASDLEQALAESQRLMGAIAHCRHRMMQIEPEPQQKRRPSVVLETV